MMTIGWRLCLVSESFCIFGGGKGRSVRKVLSNAVPCMGNKVYYSIYSLDSLNVDLYINDDLQLLFDLLHLY